MKKIIFLFITLTLTLLLFSCNMQMFQSIRIVTDPVLELPLGTRTNVFSEFLDIDAELDSMTEDTEGLSVQAGTAVGSPIVLELVQEMIDISINDFAGETLELDSLDETIDTVSFTVPNITIPEETIELGFDPIDLPISASVPTVTISPIPEVDGSAPLSTPPISATGFTSLTFATGTLTGAVVVTGGSGSQTVQITSATIMDGATVVVSASNTTITADGNLLFDLTGVTLPSNFTIDFGVTVSNAVPANTFDLDLTFDFSADTTVSGADGITVDEEVNGTFAIPLASADLISATIGAGSIDIALAFPVSWTNLDKTIDMDLIQGGSTISTYSGAIPASWDLTGVDITQGDMTLDYTVYVNTTAATTSSFEVTTGVNEITGTANAAITNFSTLVMTSGDMDFEKEIATNLGSDITDLVTSITFDPAAGITIDLDNQLPTDIDVTVTSAALAISSSYTYTSLTSGDHTWGIPGVGDTLTISSVVDSAIDTDSEPDVDFIVAVALSGYDSDAGTMTFSNVNAGQPYSLSGNVAANLEVDSIEIAGATMNDQFPALGDDPLDFSEMGDFLPDTISFNNISADLDFTIDDDDASTTISLDMEVYAEYDYDDDNDDLTADVTDTIWLVGTSGSPETLTGTSVIPISGLDTIINNRASNLVIYYDVNVNSATINISDPDVDQNIRASVIAEIPFILHASSNSPLEDENGDPLIPAADEDLFGRDGTEDDELNDYLDMIKEAGVHVTFSNSLPATGSDILGIGFSMTETSNPAGYSDFSLVREILIQPGVTTTLNLSLTGADVDRMVADSSFEPVYDIYLIGEYTDVSETTLTGYSGDHTLVEGFDMDVLVWMDMESDVDYVIDLGGE